MSASRSESEPRSLALTLLAAAAVLGVCLPLAAPGFVGGHEGPAYLFRAAEFSGQLLEGEARPRWCPDFYWGYGYPFFVYYPPGLFYLASAGIAAGWSAATALEVVTALGWVLFFFGVRRLCGLWTRPRAATVGSIAAVVATYRLGQVYVRGDLAEAFGTAVLPWLLAEFILLIRTTPPAAPRRVVAARAALLLGLVFHLHTLTAVAACMSVGLIGVGGVFARGGDSRGFVGTLRAATAGGLGVLLGAAYWLPAKLGQPAVRTEQMLDRVPGEFSWWYGDHFVTWWQRFDPTLQFGDSLPGAGDTMSFGSSPVVWLLVAGAVATMLRESAFARRAVGPLAALLAANAMMMAFSKPIWDVAPLLPWFQFPWRILLVEGLAAAVLVALVVDRLGDRRPRAAAATAALLLAAAVPGLVATWTHARGASVRLMPDQASAIESPRAIETIGLHHPRGIGYTVTTAARNEYLPKTVKIAPDAHPDAPGRIRPLHDLGPASEQAGAWRRWVVDLPQAGVHQVSWFAFPGLRATLDGEPLELLGGHDPYGLVRFVLPAGAHVVDVWYDRPPPQRLASGLSCFGLLLVFCLVFRARGAEAGPSPA